MLFKIGWDNNIKKRDKVCSIKILSLKYWIPTRAKLTLVMGKVYMIISRIRKEKGGKKRKVRIRRLR
jgi:hypothetical protein